MDNPISSEQQEFIDLSEIKQQFDYFMKNGQWNEFKENLEENENFEIRIEKDLEFQKIIYNNTKL